MNVFEVELSGLSPLLMHADNIEWSDRMARWKDDPANKKTSVAGDDRSPAFRWIGNLYQDGQMVVLPGDNFMRSIMDGGAQVPVPGGKAGKTFKAQTQSGMMPEGLYFEFSVHDRPIPMGPILPLMDEPDFAKHQAAALDLGFNLHVKRARIGTSKHVRVRPYFDKWQARGRIVVWDDQLTLTVLQSILTYAGRYKGLGDWRPGGRTPGPFGTFEAAVSPAKA